MRPRTAFNIWRVMRRSPCVCLSRGSGGYFLLLRLRFRFLSQNSELIDSILTPGFRCHQSA